MWKQKFSSLFSSSWWWSRGSSNGGGGGAGGFREGQTSPFLPYTASPAVKSCGALTLETTNYPITVGGGGAGTSSPGGSNNPGNDSVFSSITSTKGGGGGAPSVTSNNNSTLGPGPNRGDDGGSGGGVADNRTNPDMKGLGNTPPVSPSQGNPGGLGVDFPPSGGGGGGGAGSAGVNATSSGFQVHLTKVVMVVMV